jgi:hypothetical protein
LDPAAGGHNGEVGGRLGSGRTTAGKKKQQPPASQNGAWVVNLARDPLDLRRDTGLRNTGYTEQYFGGRDSNAGMIFGGQESHGVAACRS